MNIKAARAQGETSGREMLIYQDTAIMNGPLLGCLVDRTDFHSERKHLTKRFFIVEPEYLFLGTCQL